MALASRVVHLLLLGRCYLSSLLLPFPSLPLLLGAPPRRCLDTLWRHPLNVTTRVYHPPSLPPSLPLPPSRSIFLYSDRWARSRDRGTAHGFNKEPSPPPSPRVIYNPARKLFFIISSRNLGAMLGVRLVSSFSCTPVSFLVAVFRIDEENGGGGGARWR